MKNTEVWLGLLTNALTPTEIKTNWQYQNATQNFGITMIADWFRMVSLSNNKH